MLFRLIQFYVFVSTWMSFGLLYAAIRMINKIGLTSKFYPERYIEPKKWMKRLFKIKQSSIPRFLYFELWCIVIFAVSFPVVVISVFAAFGVNEYLSRILNVILATYVLLDSTVMVILFKYYRKL